MKIMMVAVFSETSTNCSQAKGFENNRCEVIRYDYRQRSLILGKNRRDDEIIDIVFKIKPDIIFFSKCNDVNIRVIHASNKISKTVLWYMDPFNRQFTDALKEKVRFSNFTFCALDEPYEEAKKINKESVYFLQEGFDEDSNYPMDVPYVNDISFIGSLRNERKKYHDDLGFFVYNNAYGSLHSKAVSESKINLNFTEGGTSDRTYKVLASKGFLLTQSWNRMENDFCVGRDLDTFDSIGCLREKIELYLSNDKLRLEIANNGYNTVQKFNRSNFAKRILEVVNDTISQT